MTFREQRENKHLREFLNNLKDEADDDDKVYTKPVDDEYNTVVRQLNSISWQLKRIADALENTTKDS